MDDNSESDDARASTSRKWAFWVGLAAMVAGWITFAPVFFAPEAAFDPHLPGRGPVELETPFSDLRIAIALGGTIAAPIGSGLAYWARRTVPMLARVGSGLNSGFGGRVLGIAFLFAFLLPMLALLQMLALLRHWTKDQLSHAMEASFFWGLAATALYLIVIFVRIFRRSRRSVAARRGSTDEPKAASGLQAVAIYATVGLLALIVGGGLAAMLLGAAPAAIPMSDATAQKVESVAAVLGWMLQGTPAILGISALLFIAVGLIFGKRTQGISLKVWALIAFAVALAAEATLYGVVLWFAPTTPDPTTGLIYEVSERSLHVYVNADIAHVLWMGLALFGVMLVVGLVMRLRRAENSRG